MVNLEVERNILFLLQIMEKNNLKQHGQRLAMPSQTPGIDSK